MASAKLLPGEELTAERAKVGQPPLVPASARDRGDGPHQRLVLRGEGVSGAPFDAVSFPLDDLFPFKDPSSEA